MIASCHEEAEAGCSRANILPSIACFLQMNTAKAMCLIALSILAMNSFSSCLFIDRFWRALNIVQGGDAMTSHGFSCSHFLIAFL